MNKKRRSYRFALPEDVAGRFDVLVKESHLNRTAYFTTLIDEKFDTLLKEKANQTTPDHARLVNELASARAAAVAWRDDYDKMFTEKQKICEFLRYAEWWQRLRWAFRW